MKSPYVPPLRYCKHCHKDCREDEVWIHYPICPACWDGRANRLKNNGTAEEHQKIADWIKANAPVT